MAVSDGAREADHRIVAREALRARGPRMHCISVGFLRICSSLTIVSSAQHDSILFPSSFQGLSEKRRHAR